MVPVAVLIGSYVLRQGFARSVGEIRAFFYAGAEQRMAARETEAGRISIGTFVLLKTYMLQIVRPVEMLGSAVQTLSQE